MSLYGNLTALKQNLTLVATTHDDVLLRLLEGASQRVDEYCKRHFHTERGTRHFTAGAVDEALIDDLLEAEEIALDLDGDGTHETVMTAGQYLLGPENQYPKGVLEIATGSAACLPLVKRGVRITGTWGYGNRTAWPWRAAGCTATLGGESDTTATLSAAGKISAGQTLLVGGEQIYVEAVAGTEATVRRGVNLTTATTHAAEAASVAQYPASVSQITYWLAGLAWGELGSEGKQQEKIGEYMYLKEIMPGRGEADMMRRVLWPLRRITV